MKKHLNVDFGDDNASRNHSESESDSFKTDEGLQN